MFSIDMNLVGGPTGTSDSLFVTLDPGLVYDGNFNCTSTSCPTYEGTRMENGNQVVLFKYPSGVSDEMLNINFEIAANDPDMCGDVEVEMTSIAETAGLFCSATGTTCPASTVETGSSSSTVTLSKSDLGIVINGMVKNAGTPNQFNYDVTVTNFSSIDTDAPVSIDFYEYDVANDTIMGAVLGSVTVSSIVLGNDSENATGFLSTLNELNDGIVAVIDRTETENCSCPHPADFDDNPSDVSSFILPIQLLDFAATENGECEVQLTWTTESEVSFGYFNLEKSINGRDFELIKSISSQGGEFIQNYNHLDESGGSKNEIYYRLKMVDLNGRIEYSNVIQVGMQCRSDQDITIYPNPIKNDGRLLNVKFKTEKTDIELKVIDIFGRVIDFISVPNEPNRNYNVQISTKDYPAGNYMIQMVV